MHADEHVRKYRTFQRVLFIVAVNISAYTQMKGLAACLTGVALGLALTGFLILLRPFRESVALASGAASGAALWAAGALDHLGAPGYASGTALAIAMASPFVGFFHIYRQ